MSGTCRSLCQLLSPFQALDAVLSDSFLLDVIRVSALLFDWFDSVNA